jgi:hypothetical protein
MEEYLTTTKLSNRIKMTLGTIRNLVWRNELQENIHYLKPTPRKLLFVWSAIEAWLHSKSHLAHKHADRQLKGLINI